MLLIQYTLIFAAVLLVVSLGGCFREHSGIINIGLEGIMVIGALGGALSMNILSPETPYFLVVLIVLFVSIFSGMIYSLLLAVASINFNADQTLVGTAMNLLGTATATVVVRAINMSRNPDDVSSTVKYIAQKNALLIHMGKYEFNWFVVVAVISLVIAYFALYKTKFGLRLIACGEHPQAADSVGINVYKMRYAGVLISGALGGLGGTAYITAGVSQWKLKTELPGLGFLLLL